MGNTVLNGKWLIRKEKDNNGNKSPLWQDFFCPCSYFLSTSELFYRGALRSIGGIVILTK